MDGESSRLGFASFAADIQTPAQSQHIHACSRAHAHTHGQKHSDVHAGTRTPNNRPCLSLFKVFVDLVHVQYHMSLCELLVFGFPLGWTWSLAGT